MLQHTVLCVLFALFTVSPVVSQDDSARSSDRQRRKELRGFYGPLRANNDLLHCHLDIRVEPDTKRVSGKNTLRFRMLEDAQRIQLDLYANLEIGQILFENAPLTFERELNSVFIDFPRVIPAGEEAVIEFQYSGQPKEQGRFGGIAFKQDPAGRPWINTACEGEGSSIWWPSKDQWRDEADSMDISVAVPNDLVNVSNGRFLGKDDLGDGYTRWNYRVHYPINAYNVSLNIGAYEQFGEQLGDLTLDYYVLPEDLDKAKDQFRQVVPMMEAFTHYFGEYPFPKDGYKLIQVPYTGMEHQSAVTYGNGFQNGYGGRDWTGVGISPRFDFIIIHETGHEWFGNAVTAADVADMWIHEGWTTYLESLYVEHQFGTADAIRYVNGYQLKVANERPLIQERGNHNEPDQDMYFKGALFLNTIRSVFNDDAKWFALLRATYEKFRYQSILTEDLIALFSEHLGGDLTPVFNQYLRHAELPVLELKFNGDANTVEFRWQAAEPGFAMPVRVGDPAAWTTIHPASEWQSLPCPVAIGEFRVASDLYYIEVSESGR
jgi:aminopeptidase N